MQYAVLDVNVQLPQSLHERIHPPDVIGKYAPDSVIGNVGSGVAAPVAGGAAKAGGAPARTGLCWGFVQLQNVDASH